MSDCIDKAGFNVEVKFRPGWTGLNNFTPPKPGEAYTFLKWQDLAFNDLVDAHRWIVDAPPGAGKSCLIRCLIAHPLSQDAKLRAIVVVPQTIIGSSFGPMRINVAPGFSVDWRTNHDLCDKGVDSAKAEYILNFLQNPRRSSLDDRVLVCTHAALVAAFKKSKEAFANVMIVIDEAHHVAYGETSEDCEVANGIGSIVQWALNRPDIQLGLTTATFWRGDRFPIIPKKHLASFKRYKLSYPDYLGYCKYLRSIGYDFVLFQITYMKALRGLLDRHHDCKLIIYIPPVGSRCSLGSKDIDVTAVIGAIAGNENPVVKDKDKAVMRVKRGNSWVRVINLVDDRFRTEKKEVIEEAHDHATGRRLDVIIALNMFREGANWKWADREIIIGPRNSLTDMVQTVGRVLRDASEKPHAHIHHILPVGPDKPNDGTKDNLNDYVKSIFASMIIGDILDPVRIKLPVLEAGDKSKSPSESTSLAVKLFADANEALEFQFRVWCEMNLDDENALGTDARPELEQAVDKVVSQIGRTEFRAQMVEYLWALWKRRTEQTVRLSVTDINFQLLRDHPFGFMRGYTTGAFGIDRWNQLREAIGNRRYRPADEASSFARSLKFTSIKQWESFARSGRRPSDIPSNPYGVYGIQYSDFLGIKATPVWPKLEEAAPRARIIAKKHGITSPGQWFAWYRKNKTDLPCHPERVIAWKGDWDRLGRWSCWLGIDVWINFKNLCFYAARKKARQLAVEHKFRCMPDYVKWCRENPTEKMPLAPNNVKSFKKHWNGSSDWLGLKARLPYESAVKVVRKMKFKTHRMYVTWWRKTKPEGIPANPGLVYRGKGWRGISHFLGTTSKRKWTRPSILADALMYETRSLWRNKSCGAYVAAKRLGCYDKAVAHMPRKCTKSKFA